MTNDQIKERLTEAIKREMNRPHRFNERVPYLRVPYLSCSDLATGLVDDVIKIVNESIEDHQQEEHRLAWAAVDKAAKEVIENDA